MKLVMAHGCFDVLHYGHLLHLEQARRMGERLLVSVTDDEFVNKPGRPIFNVHQRRDMLLALRCVDDVAVSRFKTASDSIMRYRPTIFVKGADYDLNDLCKAEMQACEQVGARIWFTNTEKFSTTEILRRLG